MGKLRSGYTTGACSAAAAKAAVICLFDQGLVEEIEIPFPDKSRVSFQIIECGWKKEYHTATASVKKDSGDDPDVTNGVIIEVEAALQLKEASTGTFDLVQIKGGVGVGLVTKRGLAVPVGEPAINPVPMKMIRAAVSEGLEVTGTKLQVPLTITISIVNGEKLAEKTLNKRLGIIGGLSILGTTGIVKPVSAQAWTDTISTSMDVAKAAGLDQIILSTGRTSEKAVEEMLTLPEEALVMMGDHLKYSLEEAKNKSFSTIHLAGMWAKIIKCGMGIPQTHVRNGALEVDKAIEFIGSCGAAQSVIERLKGSNTAREIYGRLVDEGDKDIIRAVCLMAKRYGQQVSGLQVYIYLVDASGTVVEQV